jgi:uncharacterized membrane protein YphA (DoxX/SURF4 family)
MIQMQSNVDNSSVWRPRLGYLGALILGLVLLIGGLSKAVDPGAFAEQIHVEGLDFLLSSQLVVFIAIGLELALGTALVLGVRRLWVLFPAGLLVVFFMFLTGRGYWNDLHGIVDEAASCGCFGNLVDRSPAEAFWQDLLLMVPALLLAFLGRAHRGSMLSARIAVASAITFAGLLLTWKAPSLPLDNLATRLKPGKQIDDICSGDEEHRLCLAGVIPELTEKDHVVVIADLSSPDFGEAVPTLNQYGSSGRGPALWVLSDATPEERHRFFWQRAPTFQLFEAPRALLRPLYRELPRSFLVSEGKVTQTFSGLPPFQELSNETSKETRNEKRSIRLDGPN